MDYIESPTANEVAYDVTDDSSVLSCIANQAVLNGTERKNESSLS